MLRKRHSSSHPMTDRGEECSHVETSINRLAEYSTHLQGAAIFLWLVFYIIAFFDERNIGLKSSSSHIEFTDALDLSAFDHCVDEIPSPGPQANNDLKTFWFSQYPESISDEVIRNLVQTLTGLHTGAKSYYAQNKSFKRCQGGGQTVACMQVSVVLLSVIHSLDLPGCFLKLIYSPFARSIHCLASKRKN